MEVGGQPHTLGALPMRKKLPIPTEQEAEWPSPTPLDHCHRCLKSCHEIFDSPGRDCINILLQVSALKKIRVTPNEQGAHATTLPCQIHLPGCHVQTLQTSSPQRAGAPSCWNHNLCLRAPGTSASSPDSRVSRKRWYHWDVSLSAKRQWQWPTYQQHKYWHWNRPDTQVLSQHEHYPAPRHEWCVHCTHTDMQNTLHLTTECCAKQAHPEHVNIKLSEKCIHTGWLSGNGCALYR